MRELCVLLLSNGEEEGSSPLFGEEDLASQKRIFDYSSYTKAKEKLGMTSLL